MVKKVDVSETLLKAYTDKELIHYVVEKLNRALNSERYEGISDEAGLSLRLAEVGRCQEILAAVDKRMNKDSNDPRIIV